MTLVTTNGPEDRLYFSAGSRKAILAFDPLQQVMRYYATFFLLFSIQGCGGLISSTDYRIGGAYPDALLTLMVGVEEKGLKALVIMALAAVGPNLSATLPRVSSLDAPVLLLIEAGDTAEHQNICDALDRVLREHQKEVKSIRYDRGGGHNLFHGAGYYLEDIKAFLHERMDGQ